MGRRAEIAFAVLILAASALVMAAPLVGRAGHARLADVTMAIAAMAGVGSFVWAGLHTLRAARRRDDGDSREGPR